VTHAALPDDAAFEAFVRGGCDVAVLAVPVDQARPYFEKLAAWGFTGIITDTASTKGRICALADETLPNPGIFLPGHPMAGSEVNGIDGAREHLFRGAHWILCPDERTPADAYTAFHDLLTSIGARVIPLPREDHDAAVAVVSHVPHIVASSLVQLANHHVDDQGALFRLAAGGFKDSTRIAAGSSRLWSGILLDNAEEVSGNLRELRGIIESYRLAIASGNRRLLQELLEQSAEARRAIPAKWVPATERLFEARIPMRNRQGAIAEITTSAGTHGCNIQSIEIDHLTASTAVLSLVLTDEGDMKAFADELRVSGYAVSVEPLTAKEYAHVDE
jgi:prephenate dehydrogenase